MSDSNTEYQKEYRKKNRERLNQWQKDWRKKHYKRRKELTAKTTRKYRENNQKSIREYNREYSRRPEVIEREKRRKQLKRDTDPIFRLNNSLSSGILHFLKSNKISKNKRHWEEIVGYTSQELKEWLENLFQPGMSWANYGEWHIDHIIPVSFFRYSSVSDVEFKY